jgi:hypothetical protein
VVDHLIPAARVTEEHFRRLSRMVGVTARTLARRPGNHGHLDHPGDPASPGSAAGTRGGAGYFRALVAEGFKWVATMVLALWFVITFRPAKARYLVIMRCEITSGLLSSRLDSAAKR